jgi:SsrA-binding protein
MVKQRLSPFLEARRFANMTRQEPIAMANPKKANKDDDGILPICRNKRAFHEFEIFDTLECGLVLTGTEVKSLRAGAGSLDEAYAKIEQSEVWLINSDIPEYSMAHRFNHKPKRPRKLLLHKREITKFASKAAQQGFTLVPLKMYFKQGRAKVEIAVARGKKLHDKRQDKKTADANKQIRQAMRRQA